MSDNFEDLLKRWLRDRAGHDRSALQALAGNVAALPPRRRQPSRLLPLVASIVVMVALVALVSPRFGLIGGDASPVPSTNASDGAILPGGPEAYADDPRLGRCYGPPEQMDYVFEMTHARDYVQYLPAMLLSPELDVDDPAFVAVFKDGWSPPITGVPGAKPKTPSPGHRTVCVLVSDVPNVYSDVDITGLTLDVDPSSPAPSVSASPIDPPASMTPEPAPAWIDDLAGQLDCDGPVTTIGGEYPEVGERPESLGGTAEEGLTAFLGPGNPYASLPAAGFVALHEAGEWTTFVHVVNGENKAIVLLGRVTALGSGWSVVGLRACDASEFDPNVPLTFPVTIWKDASGSPVSTETIRSNAGPGHCGWDSAIWLNVDGALFFRDPEGVMAEFTTTHFVPNAELPHTATDTGYRHGDVSLWLDPDGDAYLVSPERVERWPRSTDPFIGCM